MKFINDSELEIVRPLSEGRADDKGIVHLPTNTGKEVPRYDEATKEKIANDVLNGMTTRDAAKVYGISDSLANKYANGKHIDDEDIKHRVIAKRYEIQDVAVVKLMDTLKLLEPAGMRTREKLQAVTALAGVVDKMTDKGPQQPTKVELHLYSPNQKKESDYEVVEGIVN